MADEIVRQTYLVSYMMIESVDGTQLEHDRTVDWAITRAKAAHAQIKTGYIAIDFREVTDKGVRIRDRGFVGHGTGGRETREILNDLINVNTIAS